METQLKIEEIVNLSFKNSMQIIDVWQKEVFDWDTWSSRSLKARVDSLIEHFSKDKDNFLNLSTEISDVVTRKLSFKNAEAYLFGWQSEIGRQGWYSNTVNDRINSFVHAYLRDKHSFIASFKEKVEGQV